MMLCCGKRKETVLENKYGNGMVRVCGHKDRDWFLFSVPRDGVLLTKTFTSRC